MIKRFSSVSRVYNFRNIEGGCILSWQTPLHFCDAIQMAILSVHVSPTIFNDTDKLVHVSTNICPGSVTNPDGYIYTSSTRKIHIVVQKGLFLYQISFSKIYINECFQNTRHSTETTPTKSSFS